MPWYMATARHLRFPEPFQNTSMHDFSVTILIWVVFSSVQLSKNRSKIYQNCTKNISKYIQIYENIYKIYKIYTKYQATAGPLCPARPRRAPGRTGARASGPGRAGRPRRRLVFCVYLVYICIYLYICGYILVYCLTFFLYFSYIFPRNRLRLNPQFIRPKPPKTLRKFRRDRNILYISS